MTDDELAAIKARQLRDDWWRNSPSMLSPQMHDDCGALLAEVERLRAENRQLRGTSTPEIEANINRLAFQLGVTLGHLHHTGGRELECLLQRLEAVEANAARLREEIVRLWAELDENAGVIAVWRRRTSEAEAEAAALREENKRGHAAHKAACMGGDLLREEIVRLREALEDIVRGDYSDPMCKQTPEARARAALEGGR